MSGDEQSAGKCNGVGQGGGKRRRKWYEVARDSDCISSCTDEAIERAYRRGFHHGIYCVQILMVGSGVGGNRLKIPRDYLPLIGTGIASRMRMDRRAHRFYTDEFLRRCVSKMSTRTARPARVSDERR